jgi:hypothetical protein
MRGSFIILVLALAVDFGCGRIAVLVSSDSSSDADSWDSVDALDRDNLEVEAPCLHDSDCYNGFACDGQERCVDGVCMPGEPLICDDGNDCTIDSCSEEEAGCVFTPRDLDGDGFGDASCGGSDCNDSRDDVYPGAPGSCNEGEDLNCTGTPDLDDDQDGYVDADCPGGDDCDDNDPDAFPGAPEICLDGPMLMSSSVKISDQGSEYMSLCMVWTGSEFGIAWDGIFFTRVSAEGEEIGAGQLVSESSNFHPSMAWTGSEFVIAYRCQAADHGGALCFTRLDREGRNVTGDVILSPFSSDTGKSVALAWTGALVGFAWNEYSQSSSQWSNYIHFKEIYPTGEDATSEIILNENDSGFYPQLIWTDSEFGIVWKCQGICFARVNAEGNLVGEITELGPLESGIYPISPLTWTGSEYGLSWADLVEPEGGSQTFFARVSASGDKETDDIVISHPTNIFSQSPAMVWTGSEFGLVYVSSVNGCCTDFLPHLVFVRLNRNGDVLSEYEFLDEEAEISLESTLDVVWTGSELGMVWVWNHYSSQSGTYFNRIGFCD